MTETELIKISESANEILGVIKEIESEVNEINTQLGDIALKSDTVINAGLDILKLGANVGAEVGRRHKEGEIDDRSAKVGKYISGGIALVGGAVSIYGWLQKKANEAEIRNQLEEMIRKRKQLYETKGETVVKFIKYTEDTESWLRDNLRNICQTCLPEEKVQRRDSLHESIFLLTKSYVSIKLCRNNLLIINKYFKEFSEGRYCVFFQEDEISQLKNNITTIFDDLYRFSIPVTDKPVTVTEGALFFLNNPSVVENSERWRQLYKKAGSSAKRLLKGSKSKEYANAIDFGAVVTAHINKLNELYAPTRFFSFQRLNQLSDRIKNYDVDDSNKSTIVEYVDKLNNDRTIWWDIDRVILMELMDEPQWNSMAFPKFIGGLFTGGLGGAILGAIIGAIVGIFTGSISIAAGYGAGIGAGVIGLRVASSNYTDEVKKLQARWLNRIMKKYYNIRIKYALGKKGFLEMLFG